LKTHFFAAIVLLAFAGSAHAQLPLPGQSTPTLAYQGTFENVHHDGTIDYGVDIGHYGSAPLNGPKGYQTQETYVLSKYVNDGVWIVVNAFPANESYNNGSLQKPNESSNVINDHVAKLTYGPGIYEYNLIIKAYNPVNGATVPLWSQSTNFATN
jgi:hypothetical protein